MALDDYRRKRDFTKSPEPTGDHDAVSPAPRNRRDKPLFFCVQKHLASHLHYDLRLEYDGVLMSWAVPKGPSLDPSIKRLAMHVEDHPIAYGEFEGVIPEGYGAGIVMLWDRGTWQPQIDDVHEALQKGDLKFALDGYKLKGSWALVRTRGFGSSRDDGRSWLLIKHKDDWSGDLDIAAFAPLSVKTNHDFAEILGAKTPDIWHTNRPAKGGEAGAMLREVIEKAAALHGGQPAAPAPTPKAPRARPAPTAKRKPAAASGTAVQKRTSNPSRGRSTKRARKEQK